MGFISADGSPEGRLEPMLLQLLYYLQIDNIILIDVDQSSINRSSPLVNRWLVD
jgi:hypothetical protein